MTVFQMRLAFECVDPKYGPSTKVMGIIQSFRELNRRKVRRRKESLLSPELAHLIFCSRTAIYTIDFSGSPAFRLRLN